METLVLAAETFSCPSFWVSTIAATAHVAFELDPMALVVAMVETISALDCCRIFFTVFALPSNISCFKLFGANTQSCSVVELVKIWLVLLADSRPEDFN